MSAIGRYQGKSGPDEDIEFQEIFDPLRKSRGRFYVSRLHWNALDYY
jgi:hypothetical protein